MLNSKKIISLIICVMVVFNMCSCSNSKKTAGKNTTIHWYMPKPIDNMSDQDIVENKVNETFNEKIGATLKMHLIDTAAWEDKINVMVSSGEEFDICFTSAWSNKFINNVQKGSFLELNDLLDKYGEDIKSKVDPRAFEAVTIKNKILAVPSQNTYTSPSMISIKKEFVDKYQFDYKNVHGLADLEPFLATIKQNEQGIIPILVMGTGGISDKLIERYSDDSIPCLLYNEETGKFDFKYEVPEFIESYRTIYNYYQKGYIAKDAATKTDYTSEAKLGTYAVLRGAGAYTEDGSKSSAAYGFPCVEVLFGYSRVITGTVENAMNAISVTSKNPEIAMQMLNLIWKDPNLSNTLAYGVEGVNYAVKSKTSDENKSVLPKSGNEQTWALWHNWIGPLWDQWDSPWNSAQALKEMRKINDIAQTSSILGFAFNMQPVKAEAAQISSIMKEIQPILSTGSMPDFEQYRQTMLRKFKEAGMEKYLNEANRQLSDWKQIKKASN